MTATDLIPFNYGSHEVRTLIIDGEPWFVLADLARVLGIAGVGRLASRLDEGVRQAHTLETRGGRQEMTIVSEAGMYEVVIRSDKPEAVAFRRWITHEVLPSIRKTGGYGSAVPALPDRRALAQMVIDAEDRAAELAAQIEAQAPAIAYPERYIAEDDDVITIDNVAAQYGVAGHVVRDLLTDKGIARRRVIASHFSETKQHTVKDYEWRAAQGAGAKYSHVFDLRPQHNVRRHANGQVRQTLYVRQFYAQQLAQVLGLAQTTLDIDHKDAA